MKLNVSFTFISFLMFSNIHAQVYPTFGAETKVTITGLSFDAMEPFISTDGSILFFNSLNSGGNTNLYYASKLNDSIFNFEGLVGGCYDSSANHLDAVASMDSSNTFYWASLRSIPNLYRGNYISGNVSSISKIYGTCNVFTPGWIIMDASIDFQGNLLFYSNAYFGPTFTECVGVPCEAILAIGEKVNDSTFNKTPYSDTILANVNDTNYIAYAPQITKDGLELYFTRLLKGGFNTEICVSVRAVTTEPFSLPTVIYSSFGNFPEAASPTTDKQKIYYHKKDGSSVYSIYLRYRTGSIGINEEIYTKGFQVFPNPTHSICTINFSEPIEYFTATLYSTEGRELQKFINATTIDLRQFENGVYYLNVLSDKINHTLKIIKEN